MSFGDIKTPKGLQELNKFLEDRSYIVGYTPTKADLSIFGAFSSEPSGNVPNVQRWYRHIQSYDVKEKSSWGGQPWEDGKDYAQSEDDVDLFGSDEEDEDTARIREARVAAYAAKKSKKPALIAKSSVLLDVKPWDDETDMKELEKCVRTVVMDGLLWGASKLVAVGYGINKLQICCVIEDDKVSTDLLCEKIQEYEDYVQSVDIAAFNKI